MTITSAAPARITVVTNAETNLTITSITLFGTITASGNTSIWPDTHFVIQMLLVRGTAPKTPDIIIMVVYFTGMLRK